MLSNRRLRYESPLTLPGMIVFRSFLRDAPQESINREKGGFALVTMRSVLAIFQHDG
jgi:hypothetical protein